jgi:CheY-like chemotaxis protein
MKKCAALIVEGDGSVQRLLQVVLRKHCESVDLAADGEAAIAMVRDGSYDLVLLDLMLPKANGLAVSEAIQALPVKPKVIVLSAISRYFADRFPQDTLVLQKPFDIVDLMLPEIGGEELLGFLEQTQPKYLRRVVVTTASPGRMSCEFLQRICRLLAKPFDIDELVLIAKECAQPDAA